MPEFEVTLLRATDLPAGDPKYFGVGGKSDPYVVFWMGDDKYKSSKKGGTLEPEWVPAERFRFTVDDVGQRVLHVEVMDGDFGMTDDALCRFDLPLADFMEKANESVVDSYKLQVNDKFKSQDSSPELELEVMLRIEDDSIKRLRVWENEEYNYRQREWLPADNKQKRQWSNFANLKSAYNFDQVTPPVPDGYQASGWSFLTSHGDSHGWEYADDFAGPWSSTPGSSTCRRRLWENVCKPRDDQ